MRILKRTNLWMILVLVLSLFLAACGAPESEEEEEVQSEDLLPIEVEISTNPAVESLKVGESFTIQAKVTQGDELVNDAEDVQFEFWKKDQESDDHVMVEGESQGDGIYSIEKQVKEAGIYYVVSHVTARDMHNMPKQELVIGDVDQSELSSGEEEENHSHMGDVMAHVMVDDTVTKSKEVSLIGHIMNENGPITEAEVRFEVWKDGEEKHTFLDANEKEEKGKYMVMHSFEESGLYHVKLHVVKGDLHTHKDKMVTIE